MASFNKVILIGNLTRDPELRRTSSGAAVCDIRLAVNENFRSKSGERVERVLYVDVSVWGQSAESCGKFLHKGSPIFVEGRLQYDEWESPHGEKRNKLRVAALRIQFLSSAPSKGAYGQQFQETADDSADSAFGSDDEDVPF